MCPLSPVVELNFILIHPVMNVCVRIELMIETAQLAFIVSSLNDKQANSLEIMEAIKPYDVIIANPSFGTAKAWTIDNWGSFALNQKT